jgi:hypothetical protein
MPARNSIMAIIVAGPNRIKGRFSVRQEKKCNVSDEMMAISAICRGYRKRNRFCGCTNSMQMYHKRNLKAQRDMGGGG